MLYSTITLINDLVFVQNAFSVIFVIAVCILFLSELKWPKSKSSIKKTSDIKTKHHKINK